MDERNPAERPERFPIRRRLRLAIAASVLLTALGSFGFVGLLRMSALGVHKAVSLFGESTPWPGAPAPAALGVKTLESGRISLPEGSGWVEIEGRRIAPTGETSINLLFSLPPLSSAGSQRGRVGAVSADLESPPLDFERQLDASTGTIPTRVGLEGLGRVVRVAADARDEVEVPSAELGSAACRDLVTLIPEGGVAQQFLPTPLLVRLTDAAGLPRPGVQVALYRTPIGGQPQRQVVAPTDAFGLALLETILDAEAAYALQWSCDAVEVSASLHLPIRADGMLMRWRAEPLGSDGLLRLETSELRTRSVWQADLFCGGLWTATTAAEQRQGASAIQFAWPAAAAGNLCLAQASAQPYLGQPQHASAWILPATDEATLREQTLSLFDTMAGAASGPLQVQLGGSSRALLQAASGAQQALALRWLLAWIPHRFESRPLLADSAARDLEAMAKHKKVWRLRFRLALAGGALGLVLVWLPLAVGRALADEATARQVALEEEAAAGLTRSRAVIVRLVLFVLLALAALAAMVWVIS